MMSIGASIRGLGYNASAWRHPDVDPTVQGSISFHAEAAKKAEAAKLDFVFLADNLAATSMEDRPKGGARPWARQHYARTAHSDGRHRCPDQ